MKSAVLILIMLTAGIAEAQQSPPSPASPTPPRGACGEQRPETCPMIHDPVCGYTAAGDKKTYTNACVACADRATTAHSPGPCR